MNRKQISIALATALVATVGITGCKKKEEPVVAPAVATTPQAASTPAPATATVSVISVDLGSAVGGDNRLTAPTTTFKPTDPIIASVNTSGAAAGNSLQANWTYQDGTQVHSESRAMEGADSIYAFTISNPQGWPVGKYRVEVSLDGGTPQMREFEVK
ncbi:MAG: hypothetical protein Q4G62_06990 [Pseudomonadota bacterium]|nr:hypothetical protein [Pseudomonadota bacterium]